MLFRGDGEADKGVLAVAPESRVPVRREGDRSRRGRWTVLKTAEGPDLVTRLQPIGLIRHCNQGEAREQPLCRKEPCTE